MLSGTSSGVFKQFWQNYKAKQVCHPALPETYTGFQQRSYFDD
jgi:hypothetical protein